MPPALTSTVDPDWWRGAVIYQIYPRSFFDSNGDGVGDLAGIAAKLDAVAKLGVDALWISPFFTSPMADFGYDVSDYRDVDPLFGRLEDFKTLLAEAHARDLKVLIDLVVSHTAAAHPWFAQSRVDRTNPKADWYVWADPTATGNPPNNWLSLFGGGAWEWEPRRRQYYLHNFLVSQPDLNFHNPEVQDEILDTARFWLDLGVDGFRLDVVNFYFHDQALRDNPPAPKGLASHTVQRANPYAYQDHLYDKQQPENLVFLERFRALLDRYPGATTVGELGVDRDVAAATEAYTLEGRRLHMVYGFELMTPLADPAHIRRVVEAMEAGLTSGWVSWAVSNHDFARIVSRWGFEDVADRAGPLIIALMCALRGSPCLYQGEELGLSEAEIGFEDLQDPYGKAFWPDFKGRDGCRTPYPWGATEAQGGFSSARPWLPIPEDHLRRAYDVQDPDPASGLNQVRRHLHWRRSVPALIRGDFRFLAAPAPLLAIHRRWEGEEILAVFNLGRTPVVYAPPVDWRLSPLPESGFEAMTRGDGYEIGPVSASYFRTTSPAP